MEAMFFKVQAPIFGQLIFFWHLHRFLFRDVYGSPGEGCSTHVDPCPSKIEL